MRDERVEVGIGDGFFAAVMSALRPNPWTAALVVLGDMNVQGNLKPVRSVVEPHQVAMDKRSKRALIPIGSRRSFLEVDSDVVEHVDPISYGGPKTAPMMALGVGVTSVAVSAKGRPRIRAVVHDAVE